MIGFCEVRNDAFKRHTLLMADPKHFECVLRAAGPRGSTRGLTSGPSPPAARPIVGDLG